MPTINYLYRLTPRKQAEEERLQRKLSEAEYKKQKKQERMEDLLENTANTLARRL